MIHAIVLTLWLVLVSPYAQSSDIPNQGVPALRVTAPNGKSSTMIASYHAAHDRLHQPAPNVMVGAKQYIVEGIWQPNGIPQEWRIEAPEVVSSRAQKAFWSEALTNQEEDEFVRRIKCFHQGLYDDQKARAEVQKLLRLQSAAMAASHAIFHCASSGVISRDQLLSNMAMQLGLTRTPLESQEEANFQRTRISEAIHQHNLVTAFTTASVQGQQKAVDALNNGNYDAILDALNELALDPKAAQEYQQLMVTNRNLAWMPRLEKFLSKGDAFVNVGGAHLPGPEGLIALLRERGYKVTPILLPASQ